MKNVTLAGIAEVLADEIMKSLRERFETDDDRQIVGELYFEWEMRRLREERDEYVLVNTGLIAVNADLIENQKSLVSTNEYLGTEYRRLVEQSNRQHKIIVNQCAELQGRF